MSKYSTFGGQPTRGEAYAKLMHHLREAQDQAAVLSHLHNTEDSQMDKLMAQGWLAVSEMLKLTISKIIEMAAKKFQ
jgi:NADH:ubiquinone oxidoreductase subunit E